MTTFNLRIFIAFLALSLSPTAGAWGHLADMNEVWAKSLLVYPATNNRQIKYCVDNQSNRFDDASLKMQIEAALKLWLDALIPMKIGAVSVLEVECADATYNLKVEVGEDSSAPDKGSYHACESKADHYYSLIKINSEFINVTKDKIYRSEDFMKFAGRSLKSEQALIQSTSFEKRKTVVEFAKQEGLDWKEVFESSYVSLIHEMGHAFGLCDTIEGAPGCDSKFMSAIQPSSVMKNATFFYLTPDDVAGIRSVFKRVLSAPKAPLQNL